MVGISPALPTRTLRKDFVGIGQVPDVEDVVNKVFHYPRKSPSGSIRAGHGP
jgi:hypothetical protein